MVNYKLLTPGPLTTTDSVKREMLFDHCTWDEDYKQITQKIRKDLLELAHVSEEEYTTVLMQGSGSFGVESVLTSIIDTSDKLLIIANGAYGERMADIAKHSKLNYTMYQEAYNQIPSAKKVADILSEDKTITHVAMVHSETKVGANDDGIWRRLIVIPFNAKITGKSDIKNYADYLYDNAGPAILKWMIEGAKKAIDKEFHTELPAVVEAAIQSYREDNDWLGQFLEECCDVDGSYKEKSGEVYQAYRAYCMQNGEYIRSTTDFYSAMDKAGYNRIRKNSGVQVVGLKLKEGQDFLE